MPTITKQGLVLPELSYTIVGALFEVFNELGAGYREKQYYLAVKQALEKRGLHVKTQVHIPIDFQASRVGNYFLDFLIDDKIVLELKVGGRFRKVDFDQVKSYLKANNKSLGIIARFSIDGVTFHRVLPPQDL